MVAFSDFTLERNVKCPRVRKRRAVPALTAKALTTYREAYKKVYYRVSAAFYDAPWIRLDDGSGVDVKRLKALTRQLQGKIK